MIHIYTDGSCKPNPGRGGWATIIDIPDCAETVLSGCAERTTNNRMEMTAAIEGLLYCLEDGCENDSITLTTDSTYLRDVIAAGHPNSGAINYDLRERLARLVARLRVRTRWVRGHSGHVFNERCDMYARREREGRPRIYWGDGITLPL